MNQNLNPNFIKDLKNIFLKLYYYYHFDFYKIYKILENQNLIYYPFDLKKIYETLKEVYNQIELKNNKENTYELKKIKSKVKFFWEDDFLDYLILNDYPVGILFYEGNYELLKKNYKKIAIVGSRKPENKTIKFINSFFEKYSDLLKNFVIVSGLAVGIDSLVHKYSIDNNINTIAVLGNGIFYYYPSVNKELQIKISKKGLLLSEYPDNISPKKYYFPYRNRIISLISDIVIVFQASEKSGSIITGKYALEFGKELIVPFLDFNYSFEGSKNLINSGGKLVSSIDDLAQNIIKSIDYNLNYNLNNFKENTNNNELFNLDGDKNRDIKNQNLEDLILSILNEHEELSIDEIDQKLKEKNQILDITYLVSILTKLEILGKIESKYGSIYKIT
ncbi:MAG: DNA-processing protein DprA [bacterium]